MNARPKRISEMKMEQCERSLSVFMYGSLLIAIFLHIVSQRIRLLINADLDMH